MRQPAAPASSASNPRAAGPGGPVWSRLQSCASRALRHQLLRLLLSAALAVAGLEACRRRAPDDADPPAKEAGGDVRVVLAMQPLWGPAEPFRSLLREFERAHPGVAVEVRTLPNASDLTYQAFLTAFGGGAREPDVFVLDVVWLAGFARAGWLESLGDDTLLRGTFLPSAVDAAVWQARTWAIPWFVDVGLLYRRTDLVPDAPATFAELEDSARAAMATRPGLQGFLWQGRQYEGLTCNALEAIWGHGGEGGAPGRLTLNSPEAIAGLTWLRHTVASGLSPPSTTSAAEEEARRGFQQGGAVFMRNWPYAWAQLQAEGSPVRGKVGVSALPTLSGAPGHGALGGWLLGLNPRSLQERREASRALLAHLTSKEAAVVLAVHYARLPAREDAYSDPRVTGAVPFLASLKPLVSAARARPVTPYYSLLADAVQGSFSSAVTGVAAPREALDEGQRLADALMGAPP